MKKHKKTVSAYMTLEISLLFPIILTSMIIMLYFIFFSYNRTVAFQNAAITALYGQNSKVDEPSNEKVKDDMKEVLKNLNENQYISVREVEKSVSVAKNKIQVTQKGSIYAPILIEDMDNQMCFLESVVLKNREPVSYIRKIRKVMEDENGNN